MNESLPFQTATFYSLAICFKGLLPNIQIGYVSQVYHVRIGLSMNNHFKSVT